MPRLDVSPRSVTRKTPQGVVNPRDYEDYMARLQHAERASRSANSGWIIPKLPSIRRYLTEHAHREGGR